MAISSFDIDQAMPRLEAALAPYPKAAMFELAAEGYGSPFEQLVACILSIRTRDEVTLPAARQLFARARSPEEVSALPPQEIDRLIGACSFHARKAQQIHALARQVVDEFDGKLPCDREVFLSFAGVGPKCANLALAVGCSQRWISVDVHVHRITNRWGYVRTRTPEETLAALEAVLPEPYWVDLNRLLVPFGKHICTGQRPHCSACPLAEMCPRVGVEPHRRG